MKSTTDLFDRLTFLDWAPGESLFSLVSRHHNFWGYSLASQTCKTFFGHSRAGSQHDLPSRLGQFVARTDGCFGSVDTLAKDHTLLAFYRAFMPAAEVNHAVTSMAGDSVAHLKLRLGILTSRFRSNHPLKACEICMSEDRTTFGWTYWHTEHQFPGVWICQKHGTLLRESTLKASGVQRFQWHLPKHEDLRKYPSQMAVAIANGTVAIQSLSRCTLGLVSQPQKQAMDATCLHCVYVAELANRGWVTPGGNLRLSEIATSYLEHVRPLQALPELAALPSTLPAARTELGRMLRPPRSGTHPLRHLVLINWLFGTTKEFLDAYIAASGKTKEAAALNVNGTDISDIDRKESQRAELDKLLTTEGMSLSKSAQVLGIDVSTAMSWAALAGHTVPRRPKKLAGDVRLNVVSLLKKGADKMTAAKLGGVSVETITRLLFTEVGLHTQWTQSRMQRVRKSSRKAWSKLLKTHGRQGVKIMRAMDPAAYAWLYRNDKAWLDQHKPDRLATSLGPGVVRVLWDQRDNVLSQAVERAVLDLRNQRSARKLRLWQIYQVVPELKAKLASLERLPLTRRALDHALSVSARQGQDSDLFR